MTTLSYAQKHDIVREDMRNLDALVRRNIGTPLHRYTIVIPRYLVIDGNIARAADTADYLAARALDGAEAFIDNDPLYSQAIELCKAASAAAKTARSFLA